MNLRVFLPVSKEDFFRFIATEPEGRYEFERGRIVQQMAGGTLRHSRIGGRIFALLFNTLDAERWIVSGPDRAVDTPNSVRYPDVSVEAAGGNLDSLATKQPVLVVEVLSPSSLARDLDAKPSEYMGLASLQAYIVAGQTDAACLAWVRAADGRFPAEPGEYETNDVIAVPQLGIALSVAEIYRGIELSGDDTAPHG